MWPPSEVVATLVSSGIEKELLHYGRSRVGLGTIPLRIGTIEIAAGAVLRERSFPELL